MAFYALRHHSIICYTEGGKIAEGVEISVSIVLSVELRPNYA